MTPHEMNSSVSNWILIVEDSLTQALRLRRLLECEGYMCSIARDGVAALHAMHEARPALVISDIVMPGIDGYELCRRMKADRRTAAVPVILLTSLSDPQDVITGLEAGADNFILKPFDEASLMDRVRYILASRAMMQRGAPRLGLEIPLRDASQTISSERAQILSALFASCEIAAEKTAELRRAKEDAERADRAKTELLARVGHELRTPLNAILGFAQLLADEGSHSNGALESVHQIRSAGERLLRLANEMLDVSRLEMGCATLRREPVFWKGVLDECLQLIRPLATQRGITMRCDFNGAEFPPVLGDPDRLGEVLLNLLSNAVKYNCDNGSIAVDAEQSADDFLRIKVTDEGMGIPQDKVTRLFTPFDRLGAENGDIAGAGLGLVLSKRLLEAMGGAIGMESIEGKGSTFWIDIPTCAPMEVTHAA